MKKLMAVVLICAPFLSNADQSTNATIENLLAQDPSACQGITLDNNYPGLLDCITKLSRNSEKKLADRLIEIRRELTILGDAEYAAAFETAQKSWEIYKANSCAYITTGMDRQGSAYQFQFNFCNASENNRRLDTLKEEPSTS
ncbi:hypothetical protein Z042_10490 [Chania multitudinisentens RB-25]|uniref:Lysozyme inhibitor LprI-like N-terminal domain-containing protein n=1 Tax=Chania multitudinisentens RB-25 TaxID=1441930 RepID=W0LFU7_9GAMM|nr:lysozyme inhibitor LprI family protein [Chania multitudinisentens]AHG22738.1 hypothetical protein Z042_10490 [Chania multitudinisentens RB-25]